MTTTIDLEYMISSPKKNINSLVKSPNSLFFMPKRVSEKLMQIPESGCWVWMGSICSGGYGRFSFKRKTISVHRFVYLLAKGNLPDSLELDHVCHVRSCVNPDHLEAVTHAENVKRSDSWKINGLKTHCPKGHPYAGDNLVLHKEGRHCRACSKASSLAYWRRTKDQSPECRA